MDVTRLEDVKDIRIYLHKPEWYESPFCLIVSGNDKNNKDTKQRDVIYQNKYVTAFIASKWWPNNKGHVLAVPNKHFENIYKLPSGAAAGNQDVWHYHLHVYPRYENDIFI